MMARHPKVFGGTAVPVWFTGQEAPVQVQGAGDDPIAGIAVVTIDYPHHEIHEGEMFEVTHYDAALADDGELIVGSPDPIGAIAHFTFAGQCGGDAILELIEDATPSDGVAKVVRNMNRNVADGFNATTDPTLAGGTVIAGPVLLPGGTGGQAGGGSLGTRPGLEWNCDPALHYAVRLTNISGQARPASIIVNFYS